MYAELLLENSLLAASVARRSLSRAEGSRRCVGSLASVPDDDIGVGESLTKKVRGRDHGETFDPRIPRPGRSGRLTSNADRAQAQARQPEGAEAC